MKLQVIGILPMLAQKLNARWKLTPHQNILIGGTINKSDVNSLSYGTEYNTSLDSNGYYVQHQFNNDKLNTQLGIRLEDNKQFGEHTVGQAALRYKLTSDTSVYTNIGTAFRAPSANDLYSSSGNPNLEPEESISYEIGLNLNYSHGFSSEFSLYRNEIENLIHVYHIAMFNLKMTQIIVISFVAHVTMLLQL